MGELSEQNRALVEREIGSYTDLDWNKSFHFGPQTLNDLLDAARTEGRGEGEPVAWIDPAELAAWVAPGTSFAKLQEPAMFVELRRYRHGGLAPLYASPIREPEISRTALIETMRQHIKADAVGLAPAVIAHYLVGFEEAADAILNLAPVGGRGAVSASDRAFVRYMIREMRSAIADDPNDATITTGPLDPDILERVLNVALGAQEQGGMK